MTLTFPGTAPGAIELANHPDTTVVAGWRLPHTESHLSPPPAFFLPDWSIPEPAHAKVPALKTRMCQLKDWTGWSSRMLAEAVGTTHPTVEAILRGDSQLSRLPQVAHRVAALYELVIRLNKLVGEDSGELDRAMTQRPSPDRPSALMLVGSGRPADAYLAALDVITPPRASGMMRGRYPARPGEATVALDDD